ncbi:MAG: primary replicative helicase [Candidatus Eremiobacteraeota bacterium]|nr:primary replicative helicase [Candidatus Eremiobacteraeota bacterium]
MSVAPIDRAATARYVSSVDRIPPNNLEAEMALLGSVLVDRTMMDAIVEIVVEDDFYAPMHQMVYASLLGLYKRGAPLDKVALAGELKLRGMLDKIGGMAYVNSLMDAVPTAASAEYYARKVRASASLRRLIHAGTKITQLGFEGESDPEEALTAAEREIAGVTARGAKPSRMPQQGAVLDELVREMLSTDPVRLMLSPWEHLNESIGGFTDGELIAIVAAAKMGKTGFAVTLSEFIAERSGPFAFFATEMGDKGIERRRIALLSGVSARKQRLRKFPPGDLERAVDAARTLRDRRLIIVAREHRSLRGIWRVCRDLSKRMGQLAGICVDHVGFIDEARAFGKDMTETQALDVVYRELLNIADHFACPLFVVIHPNRDGAITEPSRATLSQIRGGGAIENHAHTILCPWRPDPINNPKEAKVIIIASRDGGEGKLPFHYEGARAGWYERRGETVLPLWFEAGQRARGQQLGLEKHDDADEDVRDAKGLLEHATRVFGAIDGTPPITQDEVDRLAFPSEHPGFDDDDERGIAEMFGGA